MAKEKARHERCFNTLIYQTRQKARAFSATRSALASDNAIKAISFVLKRATVFGQHAGKSKQ